MKTYGWPWTFCNYSPRKISCWYHFGPHSSVPPIWNSIGRSRGKDKIIRFKLWNICLNSRDFRIVKKNIKHRPYMRFCPVYKDFWHHAEQLFSVRVRLSQPAVPEMWKTKTNHYIIKELKTKSMPELISQWQVFVSSK